MPAAAVAATAAAHVAAPHAAHVHPAGHAAEAATSHGHASIAAHRPRRRRSRLPWACRREHRRNRPSRHRMPPIPPPMPPAARPPVIPFIIPGWLAMGIPPEVPARPPAPPSPFIIPG